MSIKGGGRTLDGKFPFCFWDELTKKKQFTNKPMKWLEIILTMYNRPEQTHLHQEFHCHRRPKLQKAPVHVSLFKIVTIMILNYWFLGPCSNRKPGSKLCMFLSGSLSSLRIVSKTLIKIKKIQKQFQTIPTFFFSVSSVSSTATVAAFSFLSFFVDSFLWQSD